MSIFAEKYTSLNRIWNTNGIWVFNRNLYYILYHCHYYYCIFVSINLQFNYYRFYCRNYFFNKWFYENECKLLINTNFSEITSRSETFCNFCRSGEDAIGRDFMETLKTRSSRTKKRTESVKIEGNYDCLKTSPVMRIIFQFPLQNGTLWWKWKKNLYLTRCSCVTLCRIWNKQRFIRNYTGHLSAADRTLTRTTEAQ